MKQISCREQRESKNSAPEIQVMSNAMLKPPMHPRKQVQRFGDMSKNYHHQTACADNLQDTRYTLSSREQDYGAKKQHARWHQSD
jgi:hypothetical protein